MEKDDQHIGFSILQEAILQARTTALKTVNAELVNLYWQVGAFISKQLSQSHWGDGTVKQFSIFLNTNDSSLKGFDTRSLYRMVQFFEAYQHNPIVTSVRPQLGKSPNTTLKRLKGNEKSIVASPRPQFNNINEATSLQQQFVEENIKNTPLVKISWTHNRTIFSRCKLEEERNFYIHLIIKENLSVRELERQISSSVFERVVLSKTNLQHNITTISNTKNIAAQFHDNYIFEFLHLSEKHTENDLQKGLIKQMKDFILELGKDFLFVGEEYKVQVGNSDFYIDLLFYHRDLQCLVVFELKADKFKPEHLGQLNFYLEALDRNVKKGKENPSIGILLCKDKDYEVVEYALSRNLSPTMVAEYKTHLPDKKTLQKKLHQFYLEQ